MRRIVTFADDLTGAAECGAALGRGTQVVFDADGVEFDQSEARTVVDLNIRDSSTIDATRAVHAVLRSIGALESAIVVGKVDSRLRGNVSASTSAALHERRRVVLAPSLPTLARTVQGGVVHSDGSPGSGSNALDSPTRFKVADVLDAPTTLVGLGTVRATPQILWDTLRRVPATHVSVCDAATDDDLHRIASVAVTLPDVVLFGSSALVAATARSREPNTDRPRSVGETGVTRQDNDDRALVFVVGTAEPHAHRQLLALAHAGVPVIRVNPTTLTSVREESAAPAPTDTLATGVVAVAIEQPTDIGSDPRKVVAGLASFAEPLLTTADMMITGGETARAVLDRLGITSLVVDGRSEYGTVFCRAPDGRCVVTRPGSFGGQQNLTEVLYALRPHLAASPEEEPTR